MEKRRIAPSIRPSTTICKIAQTFITPFPSPLCVWHKWVSQIKSFIEFQWFCLSFVTRVKFFNQVVTLRTSSCSKKIIETTFFCYKSLYTNNFRQYLHKVRDSKIWWKGQSVLKYALQHSARCPFLWDLKLLSLRSPICMPYVLNKAHGP